MNRDDAMLILQSFRPGGQDAGDPRFADALVLARQDAELEAWFAKQQQFDAQICREFKSMPVPSDFLTRTFSGVTASGGNLSGSGSGSAALTMRIPS